MKKNDYTYIALFDKESTDKVLGFQDAIRKVLGHSAYTDQWIPHTTVSFGNTLDTSEAEQVGRELALALEGQASFKIRISDIQVRERIADGRKVGAIRLKVAASPELNELSEKVVAVARRWPVPRDEFTENHFHIGLGRYELEGLKDVKVDDIIHFDPAMEITVISAALFFWMENDPKPAHAYEVASVPFL